MLKPKLHRYVSRTGPRGDARWEQVALARAENEGWPAVERRHAPRAKRRPKD